MTKTDNNRQEVGGSVAQDGTDRATEAAQKRGRKSEAQRTAELKRSLPEGIQIGFWNDGRRKPHFVRFGADRTVESFAGEQDRNDRADKLAEVRGTHGSLALDGDMSEWARWQDFRRRCDAPLHELEEVWRKHVATRSLRLKESAVRYMATWKGTEPAFRHVRLHIRRLVDAFGETPIADVSDVMLRTLNEGLVDPETGFPMAEVTKFDHRKNWNGFFYYCVVARMITFNPCDLFTLPTPGEKERDILTARQIFDLLSANRDQPVIGRMAFELFGGLRASSAARLTPEHVKREVQGLRLPGAMHKSGKVKFRQGHPAVLWAWFDHAQAKMWEVKTGSYDERKYEAFVRSKLVNEGNVLRNSFATYLLALTNNPPLVARLMQHTSLKMLEIYEGEATEADAKLVMGMTPSEVKLSWEKFLKQRTPTSLKS